MADELILPLPKTATLHRFETKEEWLAFRTSYIGGSDAGSVLGLNKWKTNVELFAEKVGRIKPKEIADNPFIQFGRDAEEHIRALSALHYRDVFPSLKVWYEPNNLITNTACPWGHASIDGAFIWDGGWAVFEAKTASINSQQAAKEWDGQIKPAYYAQCLHYLLITQAPAVFLSALLRRPDDRDELKHYQIWREDVTADLETLEQAERDFAKAIENKQEPGLILPEL